MGEIFANLDWPGAATWAAFALFAGLSLFAETRQHLVRSWHQWRLDRRLAANPFILREELNEYRFRIGEDLPPLDPHRVVGKCLPAGLTMAGGAWLLEMHLDDWLFYGQMLFGAVGLLYGIWRWQNDPPASRDESERSSTLHAFLAERDAVLGFCWAIVVVLLVLAIVIVVL